MRLRKWIYNLLILINMVSIILLGSEIEGIMFYISKVILLIIIGINSELLIRYGRI